MPQVINTNIASINAQRQLNRSQMSKQSAMERLSSGLRINSARDDAAGLAISDRMTSQVRGINQAVRNANDGISLTQTAEGALQESTNILQRMRELSVQSANDSNTASDRANLQKEVNQLQQELERIATQTTFNGKKLLDGSFGGANFHVGAFANQSINVSVGSARTADMGIQQLTNLDTSTSGTINNAVVSSGSGSVTNNVAAQTLTVDGVFGNKDIQVTAGETAKGIAEDVNRVTDDTGVTARAVTFASLAFSGSVSADDTISFTLEGSGSATISVGVASGGENDLTSFANAINTETGTTGVSAVLSDDKKSITLKNEQGYDIQIKNYSAASTSSSPQLQLQGLQEDGSSTAGSAVAITTTNKNAIVGGNLVFESSKAFNVTTDGTASSLFGTSATYSSLQSVENVNIDTQRGANDAISVIDGALAFIDDTRADLGAIQNRLGSTVSNLENVSQNVQASRSRIQDADFAKESAELARTQILQQAGTAMLAQANASNQNVLSLLR